MQVIAFAAKPDAKQVHVLSSGLKAAATWTRVEVLQNCRWALHTSEQLVGSGGSGARVRVVVGCWQCM